MSVVSVELQGTAKPDSKGSIGTEELRLLLKDLLKQQDVVAECQDDHIALLEEPRNRPPPTVVCQILDISELSEHRVVFTMIENILDDLVDRFGITGPGGYLFPRDQTATLVIMDGKIKQRFKRIKKIFHRSSASSEPSIPSDTPATLVTSPQSTSKLLSPYSAAPTITASSPEFHSDSQNPPVATMLPQPAPTQQSAGKVGWAGLNPFVGLMSEGATVIGPVKQAVDGILACLEAFENVSENREDYQRLKSKLDTLLHDLAGHFGASTPPIMTSSIVNLTQGIERELELIRQKQQESGIGRYMNATENANEVLECYRRIHGLLGRLTLNANINTWKTVDEQATENHLKDLPSSPDARYRSAKSSSLLRGGCTPNTRLQVLERLHGWACDNKSPKVYWLNGMAGTGKTTIAYSLCEQLEGAQKLAASFFCSRQLPACRDVDRIIPTISYQLSRFSRPFRFAISRVLEEDPDVHNQSLSDQFRQLILNPLNQVKDALPDDLVIVVDALDECDDRDGVDRILDVLLSNARELPVKFFVTSRPEAKILDRMRDQEGERIPGELRLHELEHSSVQEDIKTYLTAKLGSRIGLSKSDLDTLVKRSGVLFIYAATVVRHIEEDNFARATPRLREVLNISDSSPDDIYGRVNELYTRILQAAFRASKSSEQDEMKLILNTIVCAQEPLSVDVLAGLLELDGKTSVRPALRLLRSVLQVSDATDIITTLHESFPNYLLDKSRSDTFHCDAGEHNARLTWLCFDQIKVPRPSFNICELSSSYVFDEDVPDLHDRVERAISKVLFYACRYWGAHLILAKNPQNFDDMLFNFLSKRLLLWMEVMNLKRNIHNGTRMMYKMHEWSSQNAEYFDESTKKLLRDAWMFITSFSSSPTMLSTPHIYVSALTFWPDDRPIKTYYPQPQPRLISGGNTTTSARRITALAIINTGDFIRSIAYSPDGARLVAGSVDNTIRIFDTHTSQTIGRPLEGHTDTVTSVTYSPDGAYILSGSYDRTIRIWDAQTGQTVGQPLLGHTNWVTSVACSPDGAYIASGSYDGTIRIWDARTGQTIGQPLEGHTNHVTSVAYSPGGAYIVSGSEDKTVRTWDARTGQKIGEALQGHVGSVTSVAYSPNGAYIASGSEDNTVRTWDAHTGQMVGQLEGHTRAVNSVIYSPDGAYVASSSNDETIRIWDMRTSRVVGHPLDGHTSLVKPVVYSPNGAFIASGSYDGTIRIWDARTGQKTRQPLQGHTRDVKSVAYSPDGAYIASGSYDGTVCIWDVRKGRTIGQPLKGHTSTVLSVAYSPNGARIISGSSDKTIRIWDAHTGLTIGKPLRGHTDVVRSVAYSQNGAHIISGSEDETICIWDAHTGQKIGQPLQGHTSQVTSVAYSADSAYIASGSHDGTVRIWDVRKGQTMGRPLEGHTSTVTSVAYSPDGAYVVSGSYDCTIRIWDAQTGQTVGQPLLGHTSWVTSVACSLDGAYIVSGSYDGTIRFWDVRTGQTIGQPLGGHIGVVTSVACSSDGACVISGSDDGTIRVWDARSRAAADNTPIIKPNQAHHEPHICNSGCRSDGIHQVWTLNHDGWVVIDGSKLLAWIPLDLWDVLLRPQNFAVLSRHGSLRLHFDNTGVGEYWQEGFQPEGSDGLWLKH